MKTEITELLGIRYPIIQGGMAWWQIIIWRLPCLMPEVLD